jgi:CHASE2 domain-containing sensor protein
VLADRQAAATLIAAGAKGVTMPDVTEMIAVFDTLLNAVPPLRPDDRIVVLERALGLRRAG